MSDFFAMPSFPETHAQSIVSSLSPINSHFFVPRLEEKPQNPIMDTLKRFRPPSHVGLPPEIIEIVEDIIPLSETPVTASVESIWTQTLTHKTGLRNQVLSWDNLHPSRSTATTRTAFLSEQTSDVFASARHHLQPRLHDPNVDVVHITTYELWQNLKMTICGTSSRLHTWDIASERFVHAGLKEGRKGRLLVDGKDDVISDSVIRPFMRIGNLSRRLENLLAVLRKRAAQEGPTIHAFAHALSTVLIFLRDSLAQSPLTTDTPDRVLSTKLVAYYEVYENVFTSLSAMCGVGEDKQQGSYDVLESEPQPLLSRIYDHLNLHMERHSEKTTVALLAYLLTNTSKEYFIHVSRSVGFGGHPLPKTTRVVGERPDLYADHEEENKEEENIFDLLESADEDHFPSFFPNDLIDALPAARKSLILLRAAQPDHLLLTVHSEQDEVGWFWKEAEILDEHSQREPHSRTCASKSSKFANEGYETEKDDDPFAQFKVFDLEPETVQDFVSTFPDEMPLITPTLSHLTSLVFSPLLNHASTLSNALLNLFLTPSTPLSLQAHMSLLHSYLLFASPEFKTRLNAALFSDCDTDYDEQTRNPMSLYVLRHRRRSHRKDLDNNTVWAVGLAASLLDRDAWPPVGADLSFFLRTVIVDTFMAAVGNTMDGKRRQGALEELDNRLGFAIRDLPLGRGRDRWLNPLSLEALDFLYMDYKPPHPLEILITPEILTKYQRIFTFLLRLTRVENAIAAVFRMARPSDSPLFPTLADSRKLLLHFRFMAQSLVSSLSQYTYVTAIGGNFDSFLSRLSLNPPSLLWDGRPSGFTDVFGLAKAHSELLDDILSACLMRSTQKSAADNLRDVLQLVLDFATLVGRIKRQQLEEYEAAPLLKDLYAQLRHKMAEMMKLLRVLVDKHNGADSMPSAISSREWHKTVRRPSGGVEALSHLLTRWDTSEWWISGE